MEQNSVSIQPFEAKLVRVLSHRPFEEVRLQLRKLVGTAAPQLPSGQESGGGAGEPAPMLGERYRAAAEKLGGITHENFEKTVEGQVSKSGFMLFSEIDQGEWLALYDIRRKVGRWTLGNPLIAITIMRHGVTAGLFAPVQLLLLEKEAADGSSGCSAPCRIAWSNRCAWPGCAPWSRPTASWRSPFCRSGSRASLSSLGSRTMPTDRWDGSSGWKKFSACEWHGR